MIFLFIYLMLHLVVTLPVLTLGIVPSPPSGAWLDGCPGGGDGSSNATMAQHSVGSGITQLLFSSLNMSYKGLGRVAAAHNAGNITGACNEVGLR